jgi:hypothetical protein
VCLLTILLFYSSIHMHLRRRRYTLRTVHKTELRTTSARLLTPSCYRRTTTYALNTYYTSSLSSSIMASVFVQPHAHPRGFLLHSHHHQSSYKDQAPVIPQPQPVVAKPPPTDPYYGHEETAKICARFIRHVFNCPPDSNQPCKFIRRLTCCCIF